MKREYKKIDTSSLKGIKQAEKLQQTGWKIISTGFYTIIFERIKK